MQQSAAVFALEVEEAYQFNKGVGRCNAQHWGGKSEGSAGITMPGWP